MTAPDTKMLSAERLAKLKRRSDEDFEAWAVTREYIDALQSELAAARAPVGDSEIAEVVEYIKSRDGWASTVTRGPNPTSFSTDFDETAPFKAADVITRLARERDEARAMALEEAASFIDDKMGRPFGDDLRRALKPKGGA